MLHSARILAIGNHNGERKLLDTSTGELWLPERLPELLLLGEKGYIAGHDLYYWAALCHTAFADYDEWVIRVTSKKRTHIRDGKHSVIGHFLPLFCGFRDPHRHFPPKYFHFIDLHELRGDREGTLEDVANSAIELAAMVKRRNVQWKASRGALAGRLLKASPKWEKGRAAAPRFINELAREKLPGNYYGISAEIGKNYPRALYLDQSAAHHVIARSTPVPNPATLRARGNARSLETDKPRPWLAGADANFIWSHYGLVAAMVNIPTIPKKLIHLYPPFMHTPGRRIEYLYTNEREYLPSGAVEYVVAAWTSPDADPAIREYADWALGEIDRGVANDSKKPILLAAYGMLAMRTDSPSTSFYARGKGMVVQMPVAGAMTEVRTRRPEGAPQPSLVNVLARGIIESETRVRSLRLAQSLHAAGLPILSVYVDGLIVHADSVPLLPPGWRIDKALTNVRFLNANSFTSREVVKLPGIPKESLERRAKARSALAAVPTSRGSAKKIADPLAIVR